VFVVTDEERPSLVREDRPLLAALEAQGVEAAPWVWSLGVPAGAPGAVFLLRSTWDYYRRLSEFLAWLDSIEAAGGTVQNPASVIRWNCDKRYLLDLGRRGVAVVPTVVVEQGEAVTLREIVEREGWGDRELVLKPCVSANSWKTVRVAPEGLASAEEPFAEAVKARAMLVQPFQEAIERTGEYSFVFLGGDLAHAVQKRPRPGDFRVQEDHGGTTERVEDVSEEWSAQAKGALRAASSSAGLSELVLYGRVDGVVSGRTLQVMEVELIEPSLYFAQAPESVETFARAIVQSFRPAPSSVTPRSR
jgi:glutathione synthase/RimK-type ligase-like ATP-grasp enzyme